MKAVIEPLQVEQLNIMLIPTMRAYAEGLARLSQVEEAERMIAGLIERAEGGSPTYLLPELIRTQGDIVLVREPRDVHRAEAHYHKAIAQAQTDGALGWELRAAISLARLWHQADRVRDATELLDRTLSMFTEEFETGDLVEARDLLQLLKGVAPRQRKQAHISGKEKNNNR
jgi:predicted ATPase